MSARSGYVSDYWTTEDFLKFHRFRPALLEILLTAETPLTVGVFGPWGTGKTSLMRQLQEEIERQSDPQEVRTVWFTAWKYEREDALWRAFILRVLEALHPRRDKRAEAEDASYPYEWMSEHERKVAEELEQLEARLYGPVEWEELGKITVDLWRAAAGAADVMIDVAAAFVPGGEIIRRVLKLLGADEETREELDKVAEAVRREVHRYRLEQVASIEQFEREFERVLGMALEGDERRRRLIVFVDDLDRCLPEKAIQILEAIKLFLEVKGTVFVLGMDKDVIARGVEAHYGALLRQSFASREQGGRETELPITGEAYLQRLVQIPFYLPPLVVEDLEGFIHQLDEKNDIDAVAKAVLARGVFPNPRQVKRVLNIFRLLRSIARAEGLPIQEPLLMKTVLIQAQWPELYRQWRQRPTLVQSLEQEYRKRPTVEEEIVRGPRKEGRPPEPEEEVGGLLAPYLQQRQRYFLLERMLLYPEDKEVSGTHFEGLMRKEMEIYLRLAGSVEEAAPTVTLEGAEDLLAELLSGDTARIDYAVSEIDQQEEDSEGPLHQGVRRRLLTVMRDERQEPRVRISAGTALGKLGDPRFDPEHWYLPREPLLGFVPVPEGEFIMGTKEEDIPRLVEKFGGKLEWYKPEVPQHRLYLPTYYIARYPVTVAQFRAFVEATGHTEWQPERFGNVDTHPVVLVTWYDAFAYTRWLDERLREIAEERLRQSRTEVEQDFWGGLAEGRYHVTLPSEAEWEKAARGGLQIPARPYDPTDPSTFNFRLLTFNPTPDRIYPWGDDPDPNRANYDETGIGTTNAVGCFPGGASPYGVEEMSGNVWEWTRSLWGKKRGEPDFRYPYDPRDGREDLDAPSNIRRVLRGGSFYFDLGFVRCSFRGRPYPDYRNRYYGFRVVVSPFATEQ